MSQGGSTTGGLLLALAAGSAALFALYCVVFPKSKNSDLLPALTEETTLNVLKHLLQKVKFDSKRFLLGFNNIKQQLQQQGQEMDDRKIMEQFIFPHFKTCKHPAAHNKCFLNL